MKRKIIRADNGLTYEEVRAKERALMMQGLPNAQRNSFVGPVQNENPLPGMELNLPGNPAWDVNTSNYPTQKLDPSVQNYADLLSGNKDTSQTATSQKTQEYTYNPYIGHINAFNALAGMATNMKQMSDFNKNIGEQNFLSQQPNVAKLTKRDLYGDEPMYASLGMMVSNIVAANTPNYSSVHDIVRDVINKPVKPEPFIPSTNIDDSSDPVQTAIDLFSQLAKVDKSKLQINSTTGGKHKVGSKHYTGNAVDIQATDELMQTLGVTDEYKKNSYNILPYLKDQGYEVAYEPPSSKGGRGHFHIETQQYGQGGPIRKLPKFENPTEGSSEIDIFMKEYTNSENYKSLAKRSGESKEMINNRLKEINNFNPESDTSEISYGPSRVIDSNGKPAILFSNDKGDWPSFEDINAHEYGHLGYNEGTPMSDWAIKNIQQRNKSYQNVTNGTIERNDNTDHDIAPQENRADLFQLRYQMYKNGIYNSIKDKEFTKEHLDKFKKTNGWNRLQRLYKDEDIIWLMNNIADNNTNSKPSLKMGGEIKDNYELGGEYSLDDKEIEQLRSQGYELEMMPEGGTVKPIVVNNPNDKRLKDYQDSLSSYNDGIRQKQAWMDLHFKAKGKVNIKGLGTWNQMNEPFIAGETINGQLTARRTNILPINAYAEEYSPNGNSKESFLGVNAYKEYQKPVQPVVYQKPKATTKTETYFPNEVTRQKIIKLGWTKTILPNGDEQYDDQNSAQGYTFKRATRPIPIKPDPKIVEKQKLIGVTPDGVWGPKSEAAWKEYNEAKENDRLPFIDGMEQLKNLSMIEKKYKRPSEEISFNELTKEEQLLFFHRMKDGEYDRYFLPFLDSPKPESEKISHSTKPLGNINIHGRPIPYYSDAHRDELLKTLAPYKPTKVGSTSDYGVSRFNETTKGWNGNVLYGSDGKPLVDLDNQKFEKGGRVLKKKPKYELGGTYTLTDKELKKMQELGYEFDIL